MHDRVRFAKIACWLRRYHIITKKGVESTKNGNIMTVVDDNAFQLYFFVKEDKSTVFN